MKTCVAALMAASCLYASTADAQNIFGQLQKMAGQSSTPSQGNAVVNAASFYASFLAARIEMNQAQIELARAFDLKDQVTLLQTEQTRLQGGALDANGLKESTVLSNNVDAAIQDKIQQKAVLNDEGKSHFKAAMPHLIIGTLLTVKLIGEGKQALASSAMIEKIALLASLKDMPGFVKSVVYSYRMVFAYGKENNIQMPANASDALGSLGE